MLFPITRPSQRVLVTDDETASPPRTAVSQRSVKGQGVKNHHIPCPKGTGPGAGYLSLSGCKGQLDLHRTRNIFGDNIVARKAQDLGQWPFRPSSHFMYYQISGRRRFIWENEALSLEPGDLALFYRDQTYSNQRVLTAGYQAINLQFELLPEDRLLNALPDDGWSHLVGRIPL